MLLQVLAISCRYCGLTISWVPRQITYISPSGLFLLALACQRSKGERCGKKVFPANRERRKFAGEVNSGGGPILGVDIVGWVGPGDSLRAHLDPRSFAVLWMTRRDHSHEGRSHYRSKREKKEKIKEVSVVRFASWEKARSCHLERTRAPTSARAHEPREERREVPTSLVSPSSLHPVDPGHSQSLSVIIRASMILSVLREAWTEQHGDLDRSNVARGGAEVIYWYTDDTQRILSHVLS